jgi:soluble lytic murein transglycosylase-like protein
MVVRALASLAALALAAPAAALADFPHVVERGESLSSIAAADGLSVEALAAANGLSPEASLIAGATVMIPAQGSAAEGQTGEGALTPERAAPESGSYVVQPGDTLSQIAARSGMTLEAFAALNGIEPNAVLLAGTALRTSPGAGGEGTGAPAEAQTEAASQPPYPTAESVTPAEVGSIAEEHGVPASFAEAIAEQESGFNNGFTSVAGARGVMQIIPTTWSWISQSLATPPPLEPASATANVRGGVLFLRWLLDETGGDPAQAAAGYFQGLESVRDQGEAPETEQYVSNVLALQQRFAGE